MIDVTGEQGWLATTLRLQLLMQTIVQARWLQDSPLLTLPHLEAQHLHLFKNTNELSTLPGLMKVSYNQLGKILRSEFDEGQIEQVSLYRINLEIFMCFSFRLWQLMAQ